MSCFKSWYGMNIPMHTSRNACNFSVVVLHLHRFCTLRILFTCLFQLLLQTSHYHSRHTAYNVMPNQFAQPVYKLNFSQKLLFRIQILTLICKLIQQFMYPTTKFGFNVLQPKGSWIFPIIFGVSSTLENLYMQAKGGCYNISILRLSKA